MSRARPIYRGVTLMLTRRVRQREFLLRPCERTNELVGYVLAVLAAKWEIRLSAVCVMSNHWHVVLADDAGSVVDFQRDCHAFIARALNASHGEFEAVWSSDPPSRVEAVDPESAIAQMAYAMANPVESGLVMHGHSWPGLRSSWPAAPKTYARPRYFFVGEEDGGVWPALATLEFSRPDGFDELDDAALGAVVKAAIHEREEHFRAAVQKAGRRFLGRRAVLEQSRHARAASAEERFDISPTIACRDKWRRIERLAASRVWLLAYCRARDAFAGGHRDATFPHGTYQMRVRYNVKCQSPPT